MSSICRRWGLVGWGSLVVVACGEGRAGNLFSLDAGTLELPTGGRGGRGGSPGGSGAAGAAPGDAGIGNAGDAGNAGTGNVADPDAGDASPCAEDCDDDNECTVDSCDEGTCVHAAVASGEACGSSRDDECTAPDTCDGDGFCRSNDNTSGAACPGGSCTLGECVDGQPVGCPAEVVLALPFEASWRTVGGTDLYEGACDAANTPDFAVVFTAPAAGTYRFEAAGVVGEGDPESADDELASEVADSVLTIAEGSCSGSGAAQLDCNDDVDGGSFDSRVDLELAADQTVTIYVNEFREVLPGGGSGTLTITELE